MEENDHTVDWKKVKAPSQLSEDDRAAIFRMAFLGYRDALKGGGIPPELLDRWEKEGRANPGGEHDQLFRELDATHRAEIISMIKVIRRAGRKSKRARKAFESEGVQKWIRALEITPEELEEQAVDG